MDVKWIKSWVIVGLALLLGGGVWSKAVAQDGSRRDADDDLAALSDEFDDPATLTDWLQFHEVEGWPDMYQQIDIDTTSDGHLYLDLATSGWYADYHGTLMYKEVTGDFVVTTRLNVMGHEQDIPDQLWSLSGIMVRTPRAITAETWTPLGENWLFITSGVADTPATPVFETKTTVASQSVLELHPAEGGWVELAIVRLGSNFGLFARQEEGEWVMFSHFDRPDMPETLQVGLNAYTDWPTVERMTAADFNSHPPNGQPDMVVLVDYFRFNRPDLPADFDSSQISEASWSVLLPQE